MSDSTDYNLSAIRGLLSNARLCCFRDADIYVRDAALLLPNRPCAPDGDWLNGSCINFWLRVLEERLSSEHPELGERVFLVDPAVMAFMRFQADEDDLQEFRCNVRLDEKELVLIPVTDTNDGGFVVESTGSSRNQGSHWSLLVYWRQGHVFQHFDSMGNANGAAATSTAQVLWTALGMGKRIKATGRNTDGGVPSSVWSDLTAEEHQQDPDDSTLDESHWGATAKAAARLAAAAAEMDGAKTMNSAAQAEGSKTNELEEAAGQRAASIVVMPIVESMAHSMPRQENGVDCGVYTVAVAETHVNLLIEQHGLHLPGNDEGGSIAQADIDNITLISDQTQAHIMTMLRDTSTALAAIGGQKEIAGKRHAIFNRILEEREKSTFAHSKFSV